MKRRKWVSLGLENEQPSTRYSEDGTTVLCQLRVDRKAFECARYWARRHFGPSKTFTAEDQLEGYLNTMMMQAMDGWTCPPEIEALYPPTKPLPAKKGDLDDDIPF